MVSPLSSMHITKCSAFASKGILESLQSCINLPFEQGDLKVVVVRSVFLITVRLYFKTASTLVCTAFVRFHYQASELACAFVSLSLRVFFLSFFFSWQLFLIFLCQKVEKNHLLQHYTACQLFPILSFNEQFSSLPLCLYLCSFAAVLDLSLGEQGSTWQKDRSSVFPA